MYFFCIVFSGNLSLQTLGKVHPLSPSPPQENTCDCLQEGVEEMQLTTLHLHLHQLCSWPWLYLCVDPCEAANFNSIDYFSTQDFGINIESSIFQHNNCEYKNDRGFFNTKILNIKTIEYFQRKFLNILLDNAKYHDYIKLLF